MTTKARRDQKKVERKIYNAAERAQRANQYYLEVKRSRSRGRT